MPCLDPDGLKKYSRYLCGLPMNWWWIWGFVCLGILTIPCNLVRRGQSMLPCIAGTNCHVPAPTPRWSEATPRALVSECTPRSRLPGSKNFVEASVAPQSYGS